MPGDAKSALPLIAGATAGMAESFLTYPTEYVKTVSQLSSTGPAPTGPLQIARDLLRTRGISAFYKGCVPVITGNGLKAGTRFFVYETLRDALRDEQGRLSMGRNVLAGVGAGCIESVVAVAPSEAIKTRLIESQRAGLITSGRQGSMQVIGAMLRTESVFALYRGLVPTMMKQSANSAVRFTTYQTLKDWLTKARRGEALSSVHIMGIGAASGLVTVYATMPFDVVKTRMQQGTIRYTSSLQCFWRALQQDGPLVFWRGSSPRVARLVISGTVSFAIYEKVLDILNSMLRSRERLL